MTIDEAIAHAKEVAEENRINANGIDDCIECAEEHEQLAKWLEELKELRKMRETIESNAECLVQQGKADANKDIEPMIREIHDLVYNEAYCKGIEEYAKAYEKAETYGCDKCEHLHDEVKCWKCIEEKLKRKQNEKS